MPRPPSGFAFECIGSEGAREVRISHHDRPAGRLRGAAAERFLAEVASGDPQLAMAKATGNYKHGNERQARQHPRNRGR